MNYSTGSDGAPESAMVRNAAHPVAMCPGMQEACQQSVQQLLKAGSLPPAMRIEVLLDCFSGKVDMVTLKLIHWCLIQVLQKASLALVRKKAYGCFLPFSASSCLSIQLRACEFLKIQGSHPDDPCPLGLWAALLVSPWPAAATLGRLTFSP